MLRTDAPAPLMGRAACFGSCFAAAMFVLPPSLRALLLPLPLPLPQLLQDGLEGFSGLQRLTVTLPPGMPVPEAAVPTYGSRLVGQVEPAELRAQLVGRMRAELVARLKVALPAQAVRVLL